MLSADNYPKAVIIFGIGSLIITAGACYYHIRKVNYEIYSTKFELDRLREKIQIIENASQKP